jgi:DNA-directed RNA polymerase subunit M/transcription elongation factor TFIIS
VGKLEVGKNMTHFGSMSESEGEFSKQDTTVRHCSKCNEEKTFKVQTWESNDGAYEDYKYTCLTCGYVFWIDGIDS